MRGSLGYESAKRVLEEKESTENIQDESYTMLFRNGVNAKKEYDINPKSLDEAITVAKAMIAEPEIIGRAAYQRDGEILNALEDAFEKYEPDFYGKHIGSDENRDTNMFLQRSSRETAQLYLTQYEQYKNEKEYAKNPVEKESPVKRITDMTMDF